MKQNSLQGFIGLRMIFTALLTCVGCAIAIPGQVKYAEEVDWEFGGTGVSAIDAEGANGAISLIGSHPDRVIIHALKEVRAHNEEDAESFARKVQVHAEQVGDTIRIYKEHPRPPTGVSVSVRYDIQSPRQIDAKLRTSNGKIQVNGVDGTIEAVSSNGMIDVQGGTGHVDVRTSNGKIRLQDATDSVKARTSNGSIVASLASLTRECTFSTSNGSIDVTIHAGVAPVTATTSNGSIDVTLPRDWSGQLDAKTSNGSVSSDFPLLVRVPGGETLKKNRLVGQIGEGGETAVTLRSSNGKITLRKP